MTAYTDPRAVIAAVMAEQQTLASSGRQRPAWYLNVAAMLGDYAVHAALTEGPDKYAEVGQWLADTWLIVGMLAEREGWPLVGDVVVGAQQEGEAS